MIRRTMLLAAACLFMIGAAHAQPAPVTSLSMIATAIPSADLEVSTAFYTKGLGMAVAGARIENPRATEVPLSFPGGGPMLLLMKSKTGLVPATRNMLNRVILAVPDLKALVARLGAAGYQLEEPINELPQYKVVVGIVKDPDGNLLELLQRTP